MSTFNASARAYGQRRWRGGLGLASLLAIGVSFGSSPARTDALPAPAREAVRIVIDAGHPADPFRHILDEVNVWKLYSFLNRDSPARKKGWLKELIPFVSWARCLASLGGSYDPSIADDCSHGRVTPAHPLAEAWECGSDGKPGVCAEYEIVKRDASGAIRFDYDYLDFCLQRLLDSGLYPHFNLCAANAAYTGGAVYHYYHWNENPVRDHEGWKGFVRALFEHLKPYDLSRWRFSCINEANCERKEADGRISKVGYRGDENDYAETFVETIEAAHSVAPEARFHVGNFVIRPDFHPVVKPLADYLQALKARMAREKDLAWSRFPYMSASVYEVPWQNIYGIERTRFAKFNEIVRGVGLEPLPIKIEEFEIHPEIFKPYDQSHPIPLGTTCYAASWFAKAIKVFLENDVQSAACWWRLLGQQNQDEWRPYPKFYVCAFYALLAGKVDAAVSEGGELVMHERFPGAADPTWRRLPVTGEFRPPIDTVEKPVTRSVECTASVESGSRTVRALVFHHTSTIASDAESRDDPQPLPTSVTITGMAPGHYRVTGYAVTVNRLLAKRICYLPELGRSSPVFPVIERPCDVGADGTLDLIGSGASPLDVPRHSVYFFEIRKG